MSIDNPDNGSMVPTATPTTGIDEFATRHDNTKDSPPPVDVTSVARPGPGKDQG